MDQIRRVDGLEQNIQTIPEQLFIPLGLLEHEFVPLEWTIIKEVGNDLTYMTSYFAVERIWKAFLDTHTFDRLLSKFLNGRTVIVNYGDENTRKFDVFLPKPDKLPGFAKLYSDIVQELKSMDYNQLMEHMEEVGYDPLWTMQGRIR